VNLATAFGARGLERQEQCDLVERFENRLGHAYMIVTYEHVLSRFSAAVYDCAAVCCEQKIGSAARGTDERTDVECAHAGCGSDPRAAHAIAAQRCSGAKCCAQRRSAVERSGARCAAPELLAEPPLRAPRQRA